MHNFEKEKLNNDDFEIEFSDLPMDDDEMRSISGKLAVQSSWLWTKAHVILSIVFTRGLLLARAWLLEDVSRNTLAQHTAIDDFELEITDLPSDGSGGKRSAGSGLATWTRFTRIRLWRLVLLGCTLLLMCAFILRSFSLLPIRVPGLFGHPTPTPAPENNNGASFARITIRDGTWQGSFQPDGTPVTIIDPDNAAPGPAPQGAVCQERPVVDRAQEVGHAPVWVGDFNGPFATIYLFPDPVPVEAFPGGFGWTASLLLEVQSNYRGPVTLSGSSLSNEIPLLFVYDTIKNPTASFLLDTRFPAMSPGHTKGNTLRDVWTVIMFLPSAGCYTLHASWAGGDWQVNFAAGS